ncbi:hypothetical protein CTA1_9840 [Colletotrichum tanaceti]|uniref:Uncharacterized protein n=1 Tax=Colletotrichum tanaceti TaxID=1306861 RepID=A0A4U6XGJ7_9PEZI|nr:hypothetical protein CTA1_9840 [Colletotrichum tanaceti]
MVHGNDFASVVRPHFDRLVKHYARRWVVANGIVLEDNTVADGFRFNQELDMGKLDWWEKVARAFSPPDPGLIPPTPPPPTPYHPSTAVATSNCPTPATPATPRTPTTPTTPVTQSRRRRGTSLSTSTSMSTTTAAATAIPKWRRPQQTPTHHKRGPGAADMDRLVSSLEALRLFSDPASGSAGENRGQMPAAVVSLSPVPVENAIPVLGPELWAPAPRAAVPDLKPSWGILSVVVVVVAVAVALVAVVASRTINHYLIIPSPQHHRRCSVHIGLVGSTAIISPVVATETVPDESQTAATADYYPHREGGSSRSTLGG